MAKEPTNSRRAFFGKLAGLTGGFLSLDKTETPSAPLPPPKWEIDLSRYDDRRVVIFATQADEHKFIDLFYEKGHPLRHVPHEIELNYDYAMTVPLEAIPFLHEAGLNFKAILESEVRCERTPSKSDEPTPSQQ